MKDVLLLLFITLSIGNFIVLVIAYSFVQETMHSMQKDLESFGKIQNELIHCCSRLSREAY